MGHTTEGKLLKVLGMVGLALALSMVTRADVLYDNLIEDNSGETSIAGALLSSSAVYNSFSTGAVAETLTGLRLEFNLIPPPGSIITATLYQDGGSTVGNPIALGASTVLGTLDDTLLTPNVVQAYSISPLTQVALLANTRYWIALTGPSDVDWRRAGDANGTGVAGEFSAGTDLTVTANTNASTPFQMEVIASTPEPGAVFPLIGLLGLGLLRLRRRS